MSLINTVLRDLDRRTDAAPKPLPAEVTPTQPAAFRAWRVLLLVGVLCGVGGGALWAYMQFFNAHNARLPQPIGVMADDQGEAASRSALPAKPINAVTANASAPLAQSAIAVPVEQAAPPSPISTTHDAAVKSESPHALEPPVAPRESVASAEARAPVLRTRASSATATPQQRRNVPPVPLVSADQPAASPPIESGAPAAVSKVTAAASSIQVERAALTADEHVTQAVSAAKERYMQGDKTGAEEALRKVLSQHAAHVSARLALANMLIDQARHQDAVVLLRSGLDVAPQNAALVRALVQLHSQREQWQAAAAAAEGAPQALSADANFRAMRAAIMQRLGRYRESIADYRFALGAAPQVGTWWIGMALSLEGEGRLDEARQAYAHARSQTALSAELVQFVQAKLDRLP